MREVTLFVNELEELMKAKAKLEFLEEVWNSGLAGYQKDDITELMLVEKKDGDTE